MFSVDVSTYVKGIMKLIGNRNGIYCSHWGHSITPALVNLFPFFPRAEVTKKIGEDFCQSQIKKISPGQEGNLNLDSVK